MGSDGTGQPGKLVVYGAGGHGCVVADAAEARGMRLLGFLDDRPDHASVAAGPLLDSNDPRLIDACFHGAIGDNRARRRVTRKLLDAGRTMIALAHPAAHVSPRASVGRAAFLGPGAVVGPLAQVGEGAIVNSAAILEHHGRLEAFAHLAPGAVVGGGASVEEMTLVGLGARVLPGVQVGKACTVGAGAVVIADVPDGRTVVGVPARPVARS